jgi:hypothetical protein
MQPQDVVVLNKYPADTLPACFVMSYADDMAQSNGDRDQHNGDTPPGISRLTVPEAAKALGISPEAVRNRLSRGTLNSEREDGTVYVLLPADKVRHTTDKPSGTSRHADDRSTDIPGDSAPLISAKDETIRVLSEQLEAERTASAELRRIVAGLVQRVPELEAAPAQRNGPETVEEGTDRADAPQDSQEPAQRRSWLYRFFFGP